MSDEKEWTLGKVLRHPFAAASAGIGLVTHGAGMLDATVSAVLGLIGATAGTWFPLLGLMNQAAAFIAWIPRGITSTVFVAGIAVYALFLADSLVEQVSKYLDKQFNR